MRVKMCCHLHDLRNNLTRQTLGHLHVCNEKLFGYVTDQPHRTFTLEPSTFSEVVAGYITDPQSMAQTIQAIAVLSIGHQTIK